MSGEFVQTRKIDKAALKITADPSNHGWSKDTQRFGYKMLLKMGWTEGKGLGSSEQGSTDHVKVHKKEDKLGIGVEGRGTETWIAGTSSFNSILARLNAAYGNNKPASESAPEATEEAEEVSAPEVTEKREKKEKKEKKEKSKKKRKAVEADAEEATAEPEATAPATLEEVAKDAAAEEKDSASEEAEKKKVRHKYHKMLRAKTVSNYSADDLNAILGTMKRQEKQAEAAKLSAIVEEQDASVLTTVAPTSMSEYFDSKLKHKRH